jgi:glycerol transport system ATP-binding protein
MTRGRAVQMGSADALFERPQHMFVGHFIGSPGMNFLPASMVRDAPAGAATLGVRPEYVTLAGPSEPGALDATVTQAQDIGTYWLLTARAGEATLRARLSPESAVPRVGEAVRLRVLGEHTCFYAADESLLAEVAA